MAKKNGLFWNIQRRRKAGKRKKQAGEKGYPKPGAFKRAAKTAKRRRNRKK